MSSRARSQPRSAFAPSQGTASVAAPVPPLSIAPPASGQIERYGLFELDILTNVIPENPYDPDELDLRVEFSSPSGAITDVGAFWYQEYEAPNATRKGQPGWKVRFTPKETGMRWMPALGAMAPITGDGLPPTMPSICSMSSLPTGAFGRNPARSVIYTVMAIQVPNTIQLLS